MSTASKSTRLLSLIIIAVMAVFVAVANRQERASSLSRRQAEMEHQRAEIEKIRRNKAALPRAEYASPASQDTSPPQIKKARVKRHNIGEMPFEYIDEQVIEVPRVSHDLLDIPGLPVAQSDVVVVGTVTNAKGYLTEDKSSAYSEYSVNLSEVIKGAGKFSGSQIIAERFGATVVLPNGRAIPVYDVYSGTPEINHRYVLFLKNSPEGQNYLIVTAYDLSSGRVMTIDRLPQCEIFDGNEESTFLDLVRSNLK
jgi:hypothetical protein